MVRVEAVLMVALTAKARKVITLDIKESPPMTIIGLATLVMALSAGYFLFKRGGGCGDGSRRMAS